MAIFQGVYKGTRTIAAFRTIFCWKFPDKKVKQTLLSKLYDFITTKCILHINVDKYVCTKCNKTLGSNDYLYYENGIKYIVTEKYYHIFKEHEIVINDKLYQLL